MEWYYASGGQQNGPVSQDELIGLIQSGQVKDSDLVWNDSMTDWVAVSQVPELAGSAAAAAEPAAVEAASPPPQQPAASSASAAPATTSPALTPTQASTEKVPTYLWQSIVCVLLCCWPAAIPAIVYGAKVQPLLARGQVAEAREMSQKAKKWVTVSIVAALVMYIGYGIIIALSESGVLD